MSQGQCIKRVKKASKGLRGKGRGAAGGHGAAPSMGHACTQGLAPFNHAASHISDEMNPTLASSFQVVGTNIDNGQLRWMLLEDLAMQQTPPQMRRLVPCRSLVTITFGCIGNLGHKALGGMSTNSSAVHEWKHKKE